MLKNINNFFAANPLKPNRQSLPKNLLSTFLKLYQVPRNCKNRPKNIQFLPLCVQIGNLVL